MKKAKIILCIVTLSLFVAMLGIGIYAASPTSNSIAGTIRTNASNARVLIDTYYTQVDAGNVLASRVDTRLGGNIVFNSNLSFQRKSHFVESAGREAISYASNLYEVDDICILFVITNYTTKPLGVFFSDTVISDKLDSIYQTAETASTGTGASTVLSKVVTSKNYGTNNEITATMNGYVPLPASTALAVSSGSGLSTTTVRMTLKLNSAVASLTNISITGLYLNVEYQSSNVSNVLCATPSSNFAFAETSSSALTASMAKGESTPTGALTIPEYVYFSNKVYRVTSLANNAFNGCSGLTGSITIPHNVTSIGNYAFKNCSGFTGALTIPNSVKTIGNESFVGCTGLTGSLTLGAGLTSIGNNAFNGCNGLTGTITIPNNVTVIDNNCFYGCSGFSGAVTISNSVTHIGIQAFKNCSHITSVTIPSSVTNIGNDAFNGCSALATISGMSGVTRCGKTAFNGTSWYSNQLDGVIYLNDICLGYKGTMPSSTSITPVAGTKLICDFAFSEQTNLESIVIISGINYIGYRAFYGCTNLASATFQQVSNWKAYTVSDYSTAGDSVTSMNQGGAKGAELLKTTPNRSDYWWKRG